MSRVEYLQRMVELNLISVDEYQRLHSEVLEEVRREVEIANAGDGAGDHGHELELGAPGRELAAMEARMRDQMAAMDARARDMEARMHDQLAAMAAQAREMEARMHDQLVAMDARAREMEARMHDQLVAMDARAQEMEARTAAGGGGVGADQLPEIAAMSDKDVDELVRELLENRSESDMEAMREWAAMTAANAVTEEEKLPRGQLRHGSFSSGYLETVGRETSAAPSSIHLVQARGGWCSGITRMWLTIATLGSAIGKRRAGASTAYNILVGKRDSSSDHLQKKGAKGKGLDLPGQGKKLGEIQWWIHHSSPRVDPFAFLPLLPGEAIGRTSSRAIHSEAMYAWIEPVHQYSAAARCWSTHLPDRGAQNRDNVYERAIRFFPRNFKRRQGAYKMLAAGMLATVISFREQRSKWDLNCRANSCILFIGRRPLLILGVAEPTVNMYTFMTSQRAGTQAGRDGLREFLEIILAWLADTQYPCCYGEGI
ncbi:hypothetical protein SELMODRAFT_404198 [Selaginella moellendorffii]|uniref:Uncharacterized protein n=1 Tax=Selaginella moellendorffii TaxID=88036 RepID=D8QUK5_SELML|nr:hypothetical protein SELMODRAFT_404198 [Selaginella moellendorffii]